MSSNLTVRYSDVMQAERDLSNLTKSSTAGSGYEDSTLSVRDARKRFEQMSSSSTVTPSNGGGTSREAPLKMRPAPPPPMRKKAEPVLRSHSTGSNSKYRVQRSSNQTSADVEEAATTAVQDVGRPRSKGFLKKTLSVDNTDLASTSPVTTSSSSDSRKSTTKKLFKRMSTDKTEKVENGASVSNGSSSRSRTSKSGEASQNSSNSASPSHKKFGSPLALKKKKTVPSASSRGSSPQSPHQDKPGGLRRNLSNQVLVSTEERSVQASLREEDEGRVVGGKKPTTPRVIEDGELKLNLAEGKNSDASPSNELFCVTQELPP
jgi:hypothetical protein